MSHHLALPLAVTGAGGFATLPIDSPAEIAQSVAVLVSTRPGERRSEPDYGLPDPIFGGLDVDVLAETISDWEERAEPALIDQVTDQLVAGHFQDRATIRPAAPDPVVDTEEA